MPLLRTLLILCYQSRSDTEVFSSTIYHCARATCVAVNIHATTAVEIACYVYEYVEVPYLLLPTDNESHQNRTTQQITSP